MLLATDESGHFELPREDRLGLIGESHSRGADLVEDLEEVLLAADDFDGDRLQSPSLAQRDVASSDKSERFWGSRFIMKLIPDFGATVGTPCMFDMYVECRLANAEVPIGSSAGHMYAVHQKIKISEASFEVSLSGL